MTDKVAPPPGVTPPGSAPTSSLPGRPAGLPTNIQLPPNVNPLATVIRLTTPQLQGSMSEGIGRSNAGVGSSARRGDNRTGERQQQQTLAPPTKEELARTIFVGNIPPSLSDENLERILRAVGNLRVWRRATHADGRKETFGFAEYEDAEGLEQATELLSPDKVEIPIQPAVPVQGNDGQKEVEKAKLLVMVDDHSKNYANDWKKRRGEPETTVQFRIDSAKEALDSVLASLLHPQSAVAMDQDGDTPMVDMHMPFNGAEVITIPVNTEDELADIPEEMRETVQAEIAAFRARSIRRDEERLRQEEALEADANRQQIRRDSPPLSAPTGPAGGTNTIPLGPRGGGVQGAPSGPRGFQGTQIPRDYQAGVAFVNSDDEDDSASDSEIERRKLAKKTAELDKKYLEAERTWMARERKRDAALLRERQNRRRLSARAEEDKHRQAQMLKEFDDDLEAENKTHEYYRDRTAYLRTREIFRSREAAQDEQDQKQEEMELARGQDAARSMADAFLEEQAQELLSRPQPAQPPKPQTFKMSLGKAAEKVHKATASRPTTAMVEFLLDDDEEDKAPTKRSIIPINFDANVPLANLTEEERTAANQQLARDIPADLEALFNWDISWTHVDDGLLNNTIKPFVQKKILEYLGIQEDMLVDTIMEHLEKKGGARELVGELQLVSLTFLNPVLFHDMVLMWCFSP